MRRILIVDDEHHIVDWLYGLFREEFPEAELYKAYNGLDALEILRSHKIDVVLLDIKMPGINGLKIAKSIERQWPLCRVIFLTAYQNFEYIYEAAKRKKLKYILKTESDERIVQMVNDALEELGREEKEREVLEKSSIHSYIVKHYQERNRLKDIIYGKWWGNFPALPSGRLGTDKGHLDTSREFFLLDVRVSWHREARSAMEFDEVLGRVYQITAAILLRKINVSILDVQDFSLLVFLQPDDVNDSLEEAFIYVKEHIGALIQECQEKLSCTMGMILYYRPVLTEEAAGVYEKLSRCKSVYYGYIFTREMEEEQLNGVYRQINKQETDQARRELSHCLYQMDEAGCKACIDKIADQFQQIRSMHHLSGIYNYIKIAALFIDYIDMRGLQEKLCLKIRLYPLYYINEFKSWKDAFAYLKTVVEAVFEQRRLEEKAQEHQVAEKIKEYIQENLDKEITLTDIADYINYNNSYVSRLFKQATGDNLSYYINKEKVIKAGELLRSTDRSVVEIAKDLGFGSAQYFSNIFKKFTGITPKEYRKK